MSLRTAPRGAGSDLPISRSDRARHQGHHLQRPNRGEILLIAGASGCGKTTLIRAINGLVPRSYKGDLTGQVLVFGEDTSSWKLSTISQQVGTVLQDPERQILGTKVINEVAFGLENLALGSRRDHAPGWTKPWPCCASRICVIATPSVSPAARSRRWRWPACWRCAPASCCWMSRSPAWIRPAPRTRSTWCGSWRTRA